MLYETRCISQEKSGKPIHDRCEYLNNLQFSTRVLYTQWSQSSVAPYMWLSEQSRREGRDCELVPNWIHSKYPIEGFYHTEQIVSRYQQRWFTSRDVYDSTEEWFSLYGAQHYRNDEVPQLVQDEKGEWSHIIPPYVRTTIPHHTLAPPTHAKRFSADLVRGGISFVPNRSHRQDEPSKRSRTSHTSRHTSYRRHVAQLGQGHVDNSSDDDEDALDEAIHDSLYAPRRSPSTSPLDTSIYPPLLVQYIGEVPSDSSGDNSDNESVVSDTIFPMEMD